MDELLTFLLHFLFGFFLSFCQFPPSNLFFPFQNQCHKFYHSFFSLTFKIQFFCCYSTFPQESAEPTWGDQTITDHCPWIYIWIPSLSRFWSLELFSINSRWQSFQFCFVFLFAFRQGAWLNATATWLKEKRDFAWKLCLTSKRDFTFDQTAKGPPCLFF